jgi:hypothetical protein
MEVNLAHAFTILAARSRSWVIGSSSRTVSVVSEIGSIVWPFLLFAAIATLVLSSAANGVKEISFSTVRRAMLIGPSKVRPFALAVFPAGTNSTFVGTAPTLTCQGNPCFAELTTSDAAAPAPETMPVALMP